MGIDHEVLTDLCSRHGITRLSLFGSFVRGDEGGGSDVDLLTPSSLSPYLRDRILAEAQVVYERAA